MTLVWVDSREATIVRRQGGSTSSEVIVSDVPPHHRSTGHVRHDPSVRHGGGGPAQTAGEPRRLEHLARFIGEIVDRLPPDDDLLVIGPGPVRDHVVARIAELDARRRAGRTVRSEASARLTRRQLGARLATAAGAAPPRRAPGRAGRLSSESPQRDARPHPGRPAQRPEGARD